MRLYWITWAVLLVFTVLMLAVDGASSALPRAFFVMFMLTAMLAKASIIAGNFMHLKSERAGLIATVVLGLVVNAVILYWLISVDAARIHAMVAAR